MLNNQPSNNNDASTIIVPASMSVQQICSNQIGGNYTNNINNNNSANNSSNNLMVSHSQSAYEIGQLPTTPLAQHQQALHHQLQLRFAASNNTGKG